MENIWEILDFVKNLQNLYIWDEEDNDVQFQALSWTHDLWYMKDLLHKENKKTTDAWQNILTLNGAERENNCKPFKKHNRKTGNNKKLRRNMMEQYIFNTEMVDRNAIQIPMKQGGCK